MTTREAHGREIEVTNLDKVFFDDVGLTKGDLIDYYERVGERLLPHVTGRPLTLVRAPDGLSGQRWFQKDAGGSLPDWMPTAAMPKVEDEDVEHAIAEEPAAFVVLAQLGTVELHVGPCPVDDLDHPVEMILDLDPAEDADDAAAQARAAARAVRALLSDDLGLPCFVKASGSKGFHVHVPLDGSDDAETVRGFARDVATVVAERHPDRFTVEQRKAKRDGRVFVDWLRNHPAQTAVAPYSVRLRPGAPVAAPLDWDELSSGIDPQHVTVTSLFRRLSQRDDPWAAMERSRVSLAEAVEALAELTAES